MAIATGLYKKLFIKKQTGLGVKAPAGAAGTARSMRRVTSTLDVTKATFSSAEVNDSQQVRDMRHGVKGTGGTLSGELSVGTYQQPLESVLRQAAQAMPTTAAQTTIAAASTGNGMGTFTRSAGNFITDGFDIGDVCNTTGWLTTGLDNNNQFFLIVNLTATVMTVLTLDKTPIAAKAAGDSVIILGVGRKTYTPAIGQTRDFYTIEHWFGDIGESEQYPDCVFTGATITLPPTGITTIELPIMGLDMQTTQAQYFTVPAPPSTGTALAAANGALIINGAVAGLVTGMTIVVAGNYAYPSGDGVIGSNLHPDILPGMLMVTGQMTILFQSAYYRDLFLNEAESSVAMVMTADSSPNPQFAAFVMSRIKYTGATKDDTMTGMTQTMPYQALENVKTSGAAFPNLQTTLSIQDSAFV